MHIDTLTGGGFKGCALITRGQEILLQTAQGYADLANEIPNRMDTRFATASAGKVFVAVGILQLAEQGLLSLDTTLGEVLSLDLGQIDKQVTIEQLLTHTSGVPDYFDESVMEEYEDLWKDFPNYRIRSNADLLPLFKNKPMMYPRGARFQYNNSGFVLLALVLEAVTGMPFDQYLNQAIFAPCQMLHTGYYELDRLPSGCAGNYIYDGRIDGGGYRTNIYSVDAKGTGAGGAFTTLWDIRRFWDGLLGLRLLSKPMTEEMLRIHSGDEKQGFYGYGIWLWKNQDGTVQPYFQGSDPGVSFISAYDPQRNLLISIVSNYGDNVWKIMKDFRENISLYIENSISDSEIASPVPKPLSEMTLEELWQLFPIVLSSHDARWADWYEEEREHLIRLLKTDFVFCISHIGSTSIPFIQAKPIVDIMVEFAPGNDMQKARDALLADGYLCMSEDGQRISLNKGYTDKGFADRVFHIHLRHAGDNDELYFRDYLLSRPDIAMEYERLKLELGKQFKHNRDAYTEHKTGFIKKYTEEAKKQFPDLYGSFTPTETGR